MDEPQLRVWMQEWAAPSPRHAHRDGRWVTEPSWPSPAIRTASLAIGSRGLGRADAADAALRCAALYAHGADAGNWCPYGSTADEPPDQREEDGRTRCFDSDPLGERLELLGRPAAVLELTADKPLALVAVRLCDVAPDGSSLLLARGFLNLTHRDTHEHPEPVPVGERMTVRVELGAVGQAIPAGHRLRLSIAPGYWPWIWPSPEPVELRLHTAGESRLELPERPQVEGEASRRRSQSPRRARRCRSRPCPASTARASRAGATSRRAARRRASTATIPRSASSSPASRSST